MPGNYAHYRFGTACIPFLPPQLQRTVKRFRRLYDMGLHGPDIFFYYDPLVPSATGKLGRKFHYQTGDVFFSRCARMLRLQHSEAGEAYLLGLLAHYALDSVCHPYIKALHEQGLADHCALESELDRALLQHDGKAPEFASELRRHMVLTPGECALVSRFYPGTRESHIKKCVKNMVFYTGLLNQPAGAKRTLLEKGMALAAPGKLGMLASLEPVAELAPYLPALLCRYDDAAALYPVLLRHLLAHLNHGEDLGSDYQVTFG